MNHGSVRLDGAMADDLSVVNSARVSFGKRHDLMDESDVGLIKFLLNNRHGTPFEHNSFRFHIQCPIFVAREWFRHRIGSFNEFSMRYAKWEPRFFAPKLEDVRSQVGKPGAYSFEPLDPAKAELWLRQVEEFFGEAAELYDWGMRLGVAKEQARIVLPVAAYTEFYWTVNARSLMNFLSLRTHKTAMKEIRDYAEAVEDIFADVMPTTHAAWNFAARVAP